ncbi:MAG TPA: 50S ribosome-binding GTPase, partial [Methanocorpusculum sp.]|nr:50S ribosome-binding GTPase [Methanocorpusculum sp.]
MKRIKGLLSINGFFSKLFGKKRSRVGIYGPPNAGKTTLANRIVRDVAGEAIGPVS